MANDLSFNQISTLLNAINQQATGQTSIAPVDTASFVSMATTLLQMGYDPLATAISQVLAKTIFSVRPYSELFKGIRVSNQKYGNHVRKLQVVDRPLVDSKVYDLTDEYAVDHYEVRKPKVLQTNYYGEETFSDFLTIYTVQLDNAMSGPEEFASFISMILQNVEDKLTMSRENLSRMLVSNLIGAKAQADSGNVINLLTAYNDYLGLTSTSRLTVEDVKDPDRYGDFIKFAYAKIKNVSDLMRSRSIKYHMNITGSPIMRHTPYANQRLYISSFDKHMIDTRVLADVFNDDQMRLMDFQPVDFWQSIESPDTVSVIPVYINSSGELVNADTTAQNRTTSVVTGVFGVLMDEEAIGYTITLERTERTPLNARGMYYNQFWHDTKKYWTDLTENAVVFILDDESDSGGGEGGGDITVEALSVTENGTYTAESGKAYSPVTVNVPSTSEFSTAEVTIIVKNVGQDTIPAADSAFGITAPVKEWNGSVNISMASSEFATAGVVATNETYEDVFDVILCNGVCVVNPFGWGSQNIAVSAGPGSVTGSGNVTIDPDTGNATITGNATLTLECEYYA